jgi:hypothetical protein
LRWSGNCSLTCSQDSWPFLEIPLAYCSNADRKPSRNL